MKKRVRAVVAVVAAGLLLNGFTPGVARAGDTVTQAAIIGGAVTGGLIVIAVIGTTLTRNDPRFLFPPEDTTTAEASRVRFGASCPQTPGGSLSICW